MSGIEPANNESLTVMAYTPNFLTARTSVHCVLRNVRPRLIARPPDLRGGYGFRPHNLDQPIAVCEIGCGLFKIELGIDGFKWHDRMYRKRSRAAEKTARDGHREIPVLAVGHPLLIGMRGERIHRCYSFKPPSRPPAMESLRGNRTCNDRPLASLFFELVWGSAKCLNPQHAKG